MTFAEQENVPGHDPAEQRREIAEKMAARGFASALAELQALRDERDGLLRAAHDNHEADKRAEAAEAELSTLRAQVERLTVAADRLRKMHQMSLRTADYHNINCQCPRCIDDEIVAALTAYEHGRAARKQRNRK